MTFSDLVATSNAVASTTKRSQKIALLAEYLATLDPDALRLAVLYLSGQIPQRAIGIGWATLNEDIPAADAPSLTLADIDRMLNQVNELRGEGSVGRRADTIGSTYNRLTASEQTFLNGLLLDNIRQGASAGIMTDAVAKAAGVPLAAVRRALMLTADLATVAADAMAGGIDALQRHRLTLFQPVQPMLAKTATSAASAAAELGDVTVDVKVDGARVQVHKQGAAIKVYTRSLREINPPNIVDLVSTIAAGSLILDGEAVGITDDGTILSFPDTMEHLEVDEEHRYRSLGVRFFDILHFEGRDLIDLSLAERLEILDQAVPSSLRVDRLDGPDPSSAESFFAEAVATGAEGVMVKDRSSPYAAGRRGAAWRKVKPVHTLDLVVLAVEWGSGRRKGYLSNIHLGARHGDEFVMLGKTFKGMTDDMLRWQTDRFLELETARQGHIVYVRPEQVVEVAIDGVLPSPRYPGGVSLRFARVKQYRDDKTAAQADTLDTVRAFLRS